jgi:FkbM family methyltransferase
MTPLYVPHVCGPDLTAAALRSTAGQPCVRILIDSSEAGDGPSGDAENVIRLPHGTRFTAVMNAMQADARARCEKRFFFLHADAEAAEGGIAMMLAEADRADAAGEKWGVIFSSYDALALFNADACRVAGPWDETFAWYVGECDYYHRLRWAGYRWLEVPAACRVHHGSRTLAAMGEDHRRAVADEQQWAVRHYVHKWGCHWEEGDGRRWAVPYGHEGLMEAGVVIRPGTTDAWVWSDVAAADEYGLARHDIDPGDVLIDIGANVGAFSYLALAMGARVLACEPDRLNFPVLDHNGRRAPGAAGRFMALPCAVWRSDAGRTPSVPYRSGPNSVCGNTMGSGGEEVAALGLDDLIALALSWSGRERVRLIKFDCEGAEWQALYTSSRLGDVDAVVGEYHEGPGDDPDLTGLDAEVATMPRLAEWLRARGFAVQHDDAPGRGLFAAWRPGRGPRA